MAEYVQGLIQWVTAHPGWAGAVVFLMALAESLAIVGMVVPGVAILFAVGALIGAGALDFWTTVAWAVAGAVIGDGLSYWLGRRYRDRLTRLWPFDRHPEMLDRGVAFFHRYGGKSVALGRFFGPVRAVIPLVAGMLEMPPRRFLAANLLSALAWAPAYLLPGVLFGASLELASEVAMRLVALLVLLVGGLWALGWVSHRLILRLQPLGKRLVGATLALGDRHPRLARITRALADPRHPEARGLATLATWLVLASAGLVLLALLPARPLGVADNALRLAFEQLRSPAGTHLMLALANGAGAAATLALLVVVWLLLHGFNQRLAARHWLAGAGLVWLLTAAGEWLLRQHPGLLGVFPDLFVLRATVFFGLAAVLAAGSLPPARRWPLYSGALLLTSAVVMAQLYFHSTLLAVGHALGWGLVWVTAVGMALRTHAGEERPARHQALGIGALVVLVTAAMAFTTPAPPPRLDQPPPRARLDAAAWWRHDWQRLAAWRNDLKASDGHAFNLQYAGPVETLLAALKSHGWTPVHPAPGVTWLRLLAPTTDLAAMPVLPHSHAGRLARHTLVKPLGPDRRLALYLWPADRQLDDGTPLWLGEAVFQAPRRLDGLLAWPRSLPDAAGPLEMLAADLAAGPFTLRRVSRRPLLLVRAPSAAKRP